ncbi:hypothetical protein AVDCRST_MAG94-6104, partial [uncultured Leptolyngbya sp.]
HSTRSPSLLRWRLSRAIYRCDLFRSRKYSWHCKLSCRTVGS